jgi:signal transduction histidine kinase
MLRTRLYLGLLPLLLLVIATGVFSIFVTHRLADTFQRELVSSLDASLAAQRMRVAATGMDNALVMAQRGDVLGAARLFRQNREAFAKDLLARSVAASGTACGPLVEKLDGAFQRLAAREARLGGEGVSGSLATLERNEDLVFGVMAAIDELERSDYARASAEARGEVNLAATTVNVLWTVIGVAVVIWIGVAWSMAGSLLRPIKALSVSAVALGDGQLDRPVPELSSDELGLLARTFNAMAAKLRAYRDAMAAKVQRTQRTMEAALNSAPDPLFIVGRDGRHEVRNPAAEALAATPSFAEGLPPALRAHLDEVMATGNHFVPTGYEDMLTVKVGPGDRYYLPRILAIGDSLTGFGGAAVFLQDVTRFRLLDDAKSNLVGTVSHELKTPLTSLRMAVYLLLENNLGELTPGQRDLLESARADAERLLQILNDLLDLARLESGVAQLNRTFVPVEGLLEEMAREVRPMAQARGLRVEVRSSPGAAAVSVDPDRIRHVFINLLSNAVKYSPEGGIVSLYAEPADTGFLRFGVRDRGRGIPQESLGRIFDKFYRLPAQPETGAGLGLAIAREIVLAHGGTIGCTSRLGEGSDFYFFLPWDPEA